MPEKYLSMGSFYKYYSGEKVAPVPTLFIHGNHECVNYLKELYFGGWVAPNIYYMGYSGVINFGGVRIGGVSGIWGEHDSKKGHYERPPYRAGSSKSSYHVREYEVFKLSQVKEPIDIFLSHDWPRGIYHFGDKARLLRQKSFFASEIANDELGSVAAQHLLLTLQPKYWFSAHLHVKFAALLNHPSGTSTRFLALDKCLPGRDFLQILDIDPSSSDPLLTERDEHGAYRFFYDEEWLSILKASMPFYSTSMAPAALPATLDLTEAKKQLKEGGVTGASSLLVSNEFHLSAPVYDPNNPNAPTPRMANPFEHRHTTTFTTTFGIPLPGIAPIAPNAEPSAPTETPFNNEGAENPDEIDIGDD